MLKRKNIDARIKELAKLQKQAAKLEQEIAEAEDIKTKRVFYGTFRRSYGEKDGWQYYILKPTAKNKKGDVIKKQVQKHLVAVTDERMVEKIEAVFHNIFKKEETALYLADCILNYFDKKSSELKSDDKQGKLDFSNKVRNLPMVAKGKK